MAVHVIRNNPGYLRTGLFSKALDVLGGELGDMFKRQREAKDAAAWQEGMREAVGAAAPEPAQPYSPMESLGYTEGNGYFGDALGRSQAGTRDDVIRAVIGIKDPRAARTVFGDALQAYDDRFKNQEKLRHAGEVASGFQNRGGYDRNNESGSIANIAFLDVVGANPGQYLSHIAPHYGFSPVDLDDKREIVRTHPGTGETVPVYSGEVGVSPNVKAQTDTQRYVTDSNNRRARDLHYSPSGTAKLNAQGRAAAPGAAAMAKPVSAKDRMAIAGQILPMVQSAGTPEEAWNMMLGLSGGDLDILGVMADVVFGSESVPDKSGLFGTPNKFYGMQPAGYVGGSGDAGPGSAEQAEPAGQPAEVQKSPRDLSYLDGLLGGRDYERPISALGQRVSEREIKSVMDALGLSREQAIEQINAELRGGDSSGGR